MPVAVLPDTNAFLHRRAHHEIDWRKEVGDDDVVYLVSTEVVRELDRHKTKPGGLGKRAKQALSRIERLFADGPAGTLRAGVPAVVWRKTVDLTKRGLDPVHVDERILGQALAYAADNPDRRVIIATVDSAMRLIARFHCGLECIDLKEHAVRAEVDDDEKKRQKELAEIERARNARPEFRLTFADGTDVFAWTAPRVPDEEDLQRWRRSLEAQRTKLPLVAGSLPLKLIDNYIETQHRRRAARALAVPISLVLHNDGAVPAAKTDVTLTLPAGTRAVLESALPKPEADQNESLVGLGEAVRNNPSFAFPRALVVEAVEERIEIRDDAVVLHAREVPNHGSAELLSFYLVFPAAEARRGAPLACTIRSNSLQGTRAQTLHLKLTT